MQCVLSQICTFTIYQPHVHVDMSQSIIVCISFLRTNKIKPELKMKYTLCETSVHGWLEVGLHRDFKLPNLSHVYVVVFRNNNLQCTNILL